MNGLGRVCEDEAARLLEAKGYRVLGLRWACPLGELDVIARDGETLVFVEVKARTSTAFGFPAETVTKKKQDRIVKAALSYVKAKALRPDAIRFDVIAFTPGREPEHIVGAFEASGYTY